MRFQDLQNFPRKFIYQKRTASGDATVVPNCDRYQIFDIILGVNTTISNPKHVRAGDLLYFYIRQTGSYTLGFGDLYKLGDYVVSTGGAAVDTLVAQAMHSQQVDTLTLSGASGTGKITGPGMIEGAVTFNTSLTQTATDYVTAYADAYLAKGIILTSSGADLIFTALVPGNGFTSPSFTNLTGDLAGSVVNTVENKPQIHVLAYHKDTSS